MNQTTECVDVCVLRRMAWHPTVWRKNWRLPRTGGASGPSGRPALAHVEEEWWHRRDTASNRGQSVWEQKHTRKIKSPLFSLDIQMHVLLYLSYIIPPNVCLSCLERKSLLGRTIWPVQELPRNIIFATRRWVTDFQLISHHFVWHLY